MSGDALEERSGGLADAPDVLQRALTQLQLKQVPQQCLVHVQAGLANHDAHRPLHLHQPSPESLMLSINIPLGLHPQSCCSLSTLQTPECSCLAKEVYTHWRNPPKSCDFMVRYMCCDCLLHVNQVQQRRPIEQQPTWLALLRSHLHGHCEAFTARALLHGFLVCMLLRPCNCLSRHMQNNSNPPFAF